MKKPLGIYVHIPFCIRKCLYCDFLSFPAEETVKESYIKALLEEIEAAPVKFSFDPSEYEVKTIYIGGGTPSCVNEVYINKILCKLNETFFYKKQVSPEKTEDLNITQNRNKAENYKTAPNRDKTETFTKTDACKRADKCINADNKEHEVITEQKEAGEPDNGRNLRKQMIRERDQGIEITIEVNPNTAEYEKFLSYKNAGINRISIGLQSADDEELKMLGRLHTWEEFLSCYEAAERAGFSNINVDIMTALPGQKEETLRDTLCKLTQLSPSHISAYSLILEEGTPFFEMYGKDAGGHFKKTVETADGLNNRKKAVLPSEEEERALYYLVRDELKRHGYNRYEISNFAREGYESRHNTSYWKRVPYLGLGLGASGLINEVRYKNTTDMNTYLANSASPGFFEEEICLSLTDRMEETMFLGLRMSEGVSKAAFSDCYSKSMDEVYGRVLEKLEKEELILNTAERAALTDKGIDYGNYVFSRFLGSAV